MRLDLTVEGEKVNFELNNYEIIRYEFEYKVNNCKYAKSSDTYQVLKIVGNVSKIIDKDESIIEVIRNWSKEVFRDISYYKSVKIACVYNEEIVKEITFPNAFIGNYVEEVDTFTGESIFTISFYQKFDKSKDTIINPFDGIFSKSTEIDIEEIDESLTIHLEIVPDKRRFF
jgi:hypothetical protein